MIARTKQLFVARIPNREGKIAPQVLNARRAPRRVSVQKEFRVRSTRPNHPAGPLQFAGQFLSAVQSRVRDDPKSPLKTRRLAFLQRFARGPEHRMAQPDATFHPAFAGIGSTVSEKIDE